MNKTNQRIAIAKICGYKIPSFTKKTEYVDDPHWNSGFNQIVVKFTDGTKFELIGDNPSDEFILERYCREKKIPNYPDSLDAMHKAEVAINPDLFHEYAQLVYQIVARDTMGRGYGISATAIQRAEAFLETLKAWKG